MTGGELSEFQNIEQQSNSARLQNIDHSLREVALELFGEENTPKKISKEIIKDIGVYTSADLRFPEYISAARRYHPVENEVLGKPVYTLVDEIRIKNRFNANIVEEKVFRFSKMESMYIMRYAGITVRRNLLNPDYFSQHSLQKLEDITKHVLSARNEQQELEEAFLGSIRQKFNTGLSKLFQF